MNSKIEWTEQTWNPLTGCTRVSAGCTNCYAERMTKRLASMGQAKYQGLLDAHGRWNGEINTDEAALLIPLRRKKPTTYFVNSMSDLFHENVEDHFKSKVFTVMGACPHHRFIVLTKRPQDMHDYLTMRTPALWVTHLATTAYNHNLHILGAPDAYRWPLPNVILGVSVEDQKTANERIPLLLETPAACRVISAEPLLGPIYLEIVERIDPENTDGTLDALRGEHYMLETNGQRVLTKDGQPSGRLDWVITGGESGPGARPMHPAWIRNLRDQCRDANVPFFFKQWGNHSYSEIQEDGRCVPGIPLGNMNEVMRWNDELGWIKPSDTTDAGDFLAPGWLCVPCAKARAGRLLDGVEHNEYPIILGTNGLSLNVAQFEDERNSKAGTIPVGKEE